MSWSAANRCVVNAFRYALGAGQLNGIDYRNLKVYITDSNFYKVNRCRMKGIRESDVVSAEQSKDYDNLRLHDLQEQYLRNVYDSSNRLIGTKGLSSRVVSTDLTLQDVQVDTFNSDTGETSEVSYEQMLDYPVSSRIFSKGHDDSWVTNDLDWSLTATANSSTMQYFKDEYNFKDVYDRTEYQSYGVGENRLDENVCRLSAASFVMDSDKVANPESMDYGAAGVLLTYADATKGFVGDNELPVVFYEFGKTLRSNYNFLRVDWHEDGVIKVE